MTRSRASSPRRKSRSASNRSRCACACPRSGPTAPLRVTAGESGSCLDCGPALGDASPHGRGAFVARTGRLFTVALASRNHELVAQALEGPVLVLLARLRIDRVRLGVEERFESEHHAKGAVLALEELDAEIPGGAGDGEELAVEAGMARARELGDPAAQLLRREERAVDRIARGDDLLHAGPVDVAGDGDGREHPCIGPCEMK